MVGISGAMHVDAAIAEPAAHSSLFTLSEAPPAGQVGEPFREVQFCGLDDGDDHP